VHCKVCGSLHSFAMNCSFSHAYSFSLREVIDKHKDLHFFVVMYFNYYSGIASCHLYVRSLPVGVDTDFDSSVRDFQNSPPQQKKLQVAIQFGFDEKWSSLKRAVVRTVLSVIFRWFFRKKTVLLNKGLRERLACPRKLHIVLSPDLIDILSHLVVG
jgi:hypothetical protein